MPPEGKKNKFFSQNQIFFRYEKGQDQKGPYCQTHKKFKQEKVIWCEDCNVMICQMCVTDDHKNHQVQKIIEFII